MGALVAAASILLSAQVFDDGPTTQPRIWNGSVDVSQAKALPQGKRSGDLHYGLIESSEEWARLWKGMRRPSAPAVDFKKDAVLFVYYARWPGSFEMGEPVEREGVLNVGVGLDGGKPPVMDQKKDENRTEPKPTPPSSIRLPSPAPRRCHYDYQMRAIPRKTISRVRLHLKDAETEELVLAKAK
jgi:hypothetical protein